MSILSFRCIFHVYSMVWETPQDWLEWESSADWNRKFKQITNPVHKAIMDDFFMEEFLLRAHQLLRFPSADDKLLVNSSLVVEDVPSVMAGSIFDRYEKLEGLRVGTDNDWILFGMLCQQFFQEYDIKTITCVLWKHRICHLLLDQWIYLFVMLYKQKCNIEYMKQLLNSLLPFSSVIERDTNLLSKYI